MIKGIFFDVGGTLFSYKNMPQTMNTLMERLAAGLQLELDAGEVARHYRLANREVDERFADKPYYLFRDYFEAIFIDFLDRIDKRHLHGHFDWYEECQRGMLVDCMALMPNCQATLAKLKDMGLYLCAVSNNDENMLTPLIARERLHRWLSHWTSSEAARSCKPDRRFFEVALEKSGLPADQVAFIGDSPEQDIMGAHALGMTTVLFSESGQQPPMHIGRETPEPDFRITSLSELPEIIGRLGGQAARL